MIQRFPILQSEMNVFFCKYDDPIYIKTTKLEIMLYLTNETNAKQVLQELKEYASEVDVEFARKAVRSIGMLALRVASCTTDCVHILLDLTRTRVGYVVQESIIVMRDVFRKYPNKYESAIGVLCENLEELTEPEAKAAIIWIIGQYSDRIDNAGFVLEGFLEDFPDEASQVKLALLTAIIKLFIKRPTVGQDLIPRVLKYATEMTDDPDLRDRGYMYWRLLSTNPEAAKAVVLSDRPHITHIIEGMEKFLLEELLLNLSSIASVYHKSPLSFVQYAKHRYLPASDALREKGSALDTAHMALVVKEQRIGFDPLPSTSAAAVYDLLDLNDEDVD
jgi:vesicle coat complex subunit